MVERSSRKRFYVGTWLFLVAAGLGASQGCLDRRPHDTGSAGMPCSDCHGDATRPGSALRRAAPPVDLRGSSNVHDPGVGAHGIHLDATNTHGAIACTECHVVPERVDSPGHADTAAPAEIVFGDLAKQGGRAPVYDPVGRVCGNTYCHKEADAVWTEPKSSDAACGSCHGLPPPAPHPQSGNCSSCHGAVVDAQRRFVMPSLHVDGVVEFAPGTCTDCHGSGGNPAPPVDVSGNSDPSHIGVGAHRVHLSGGSTGRALQCDECHTVPTKVDAPMHADGLPAEVNLEGVAASQGRSPAWSHATATCTNTWCHAPDPGSSQSSPVWTDTTALGCQSCHGAPPAAPHPQMTDCSLCHGAVVGSDDVTIVDKARHVDGTIDVQVPATCTACHGGPKDAAPVPGQPGAGAHRTHLDGTARSAPVPCTACHVVPNTVLAPGHIDTPRPGEVTFSGRALSGGASPIYSYSAATCSGTPCHGGRMPDGNSSGGSNTVPDWNRVDGTQATCGSCHSIPPPAPHPYVSLNPVCNACHKDIAADNATFIRPDLHVDGQITFELPP